MRTWFKIIHQLTLWNPSNGDVLLSRTYNVFFFCLSGSHSATAAPFPSSSSITPDWISKEYGSMWTEGLYYRSIVYTCTPAWIHDCGRICFQAVCGYACMYICRCTCECQCTTMRQASAWPSAGVCLCVPKWCAVPVGFASLPSPTSGWCSTSAQLLSSTQWLLYTRSWHRSLTVMSAGISTTFPMPSSLKIFTIYEQETRHWG